MSMSIPANPNRLARWARGLCYGLAGCSAALAVGMAGHRSALAQGATGSPKVAFAVDSSDGRASRIYIANPDGSGARAITSGLSRDRAPAFSPDGRSLAYQTTTDLGLNAVMVQSLDPSNSRARTVAVGMYPQWSRDGQRLLFSRRQSNAFGLFAIRADGSEKDQGLKPLVKAQIGRWSPDEKLLGAVTPVIAEGKERWQLQVLPTDTLQPRFRLTLPEDFGQVVSLDWASDNQRLLLTSTRQSRHELFVVDLRSPETRRVPAGEAVPNAAFGAWSPDGQEILFRSVSDGAMNGAPNGAAQSRLCVMQADGSQVRVIWEPPNSGARIQGTAWYRPPVQTAAVPKPTPPVEAMPKPPVDPPVDPAPKPPVAPPVAPQARVLGPPRKLLTGRPIIVGQARSPLSMNLAVPGQSDFVVSVPILATRGLATRRQGIGVTLELSDGGLYRGNVIYSDSPWVTLQGRAKGGKVRLIDGQQLPKTQGFPTGFKLTLRREGKLLTVAVNDRDVLSRPLLNSGIKNLSLTLENFDPGDARFNLGSVYYREWGLAPAAAAATE